MQSSSAVAAALKWTCAKGHRNLYYYAACQHRGGGGMPPCGLAAPAGAHVNASLYAVAAGAKHAAAQQPAAAVAAAPPTAAAAAVSSAAAALGGVGAPVPRKPLVTSEVDDALSRACAPQGTTMPRELVDLIVSYYPFPFRAATCGADDTLRVFSCSVKGGQEAVLRGHSDTVTALCALPNGFLVSGAVDGELKVWDTVTCTARREWHAPKPSARAPPLPVSARSMQHEQQLQQQPQLPVVWCSDRYADAHSSGTPRTPAVHALCVVPGTGGRFVVSAGYQVVLWDLGPPSPAVTAPDAGTAAVAAPGGPTPTAAAAAGQGQGQQSAAAQSPPPQLVQCIALRALAMWCVWLPVRQAFALGGTGRAIRLLRVTITHSAGGGGGMTCRLSSLQPASLALAAAGAAAEAGVSDDDALAGLAPELALSVGLLKAHPHMDLVCACVLQAGGGGGGGQAGADDLAGDVLVCASDAGYACVWNIDASGAYSRGTWSLSPACQHSQARIGDVYGICALSTMQFAVSTSKSGLVVCNMFGPQHVMTVPAKPSTSAQESQQLADAMANSSAPGGGAAGRGGGGLNALSFYSPPYGATTTTTTTELCGMSTLRAATLTASLDAVVAAAADRAAAAAAASPSAPAAGGDAAAAAAAAAGGKTTKTADAPDEGLVGVGADGCVHAFRLTGDVSAQRTPHADIFVCRYDGHSRRGNAIVLLEG